jgi:arylformamidase
MKRLLCLFVLFFILSQITACANARESRIEKRKEIALERKLDTRIIKDLAYGSHSEQRMDVYIPKNANNANVLFMVHGGAWRFGDKANSDVVQNKTAYWLPKNTIFVSTNYRMLPKADPLTQAEDVLKALQFAQNHAKDWGGNPSNFIVMGHSAGAHLVALVVSSSTYQSGLKPLKGTVLLDSAALDVVKLMENDAKRMHKNAFGDDPNYWQKTSPYHQLNQKIAPIFAVCSLQRDTSCEQAKTFANKLQSLNSQIEVMQVDMRHSEINSELGINTEYTKKVNTFIESLN